MAKKRTVKVAGGNALKLVKGECYTRADFDNKFPKSLDVKVVFNGENYCFFTIRNKKKFQNELHYDGFVIQPDNPEKYLIPHGPKNSVAEKGTHILVRYHPTGPYEYIGDIVYISRYDEKRNKLFVQ